MLKKIKIICTLGPASSSKPIIKKLISSGVDVFRINFSHGDISTHEHGIKSIKDASTELRRNVALLADLPGPKVRVGKIKNDSVDLVKGQYFTLTSEAIIGDENIASINYPALVKSVKRGNELFLADGIIRLRVEKVKSNSIICTVLNGGKLSSGKGVNAPGLKLDIKYPTERDIEFASFALERGVDFIALSFVTSADDIREVRKRLGDLISSASIIAKIETADAVRNFDSILREADGIMIGRGDLGIEVPIESVPIIQREVIKKCVSAGKPVIVATQMLENMVHSPMPTRAEVTDVSTAILDGADALMLSDETAVGLYPVEAVMMLSRIAKTTEKILSKNLYAELEGKTADVAEAVGHAACKLANYVGAKAIVAPTQTGSTAKRVARYRPMQPIVALCTDEHVARQLNLYWGVIPVIVRRVMTTDELFKQAELVVLDLGIARKYDKIIVTSGTPGVKGTTNLLKVHTIGVQRS